MTQEEGDAFFLQGEKHAYPNPVSNVIQQVTREGNFRWEQKKDDHLKHSWAQVQMIDGINQKSEQRLPAAYFLVQGELLYFCMSNMAVYATSW